MAFTRKQTQKTYMQFKKIILASFGDSVYIHKHRVCHYRIGGGDEGFMFYAVFDKEADKSFWHESRLVGIIESIEETQSLVSVKFLNTATEAATFFMFLEDSLKKAKTYDEFTGILDRLYKSANFLQFVCFVC